MNAGSGIKGDIRTDIVQGFLSIKRFENRIAGVKFAAGEDRPTQRFFLQRQKRIQGIADGGKRNIIIDRFDDPRRRRATVKKQRLMRLYQACRQLCRATFFLPPGGIFDR